MISLISSDMFGYDLDPHDYNYDDIDDLLQAMPDKIEAFERDGIYTYVNFNTKVDSL